MNTKQRLARRLRRARLDRGLTQADVAGSLGLHRPAISEIEAGRRSVTGEELYELSRLLGVPVPDLLGPVAGRSDRDPQGLDGMLLEMVRVVSELFHPEQIILFGSHARGTAGPDSDVDLLVVVDVEDCRRRLAARIGAALHRYPVPKDIVVTTREAFERRRALPGTIERWAAREGRVLYAAR